MVEEQTKKTETTLVEAPTMQPELVVTEEAAGAGGQLVAMPEAAHDGIHDANGNPDADHDHHHEEATHTVNAARALPAQSNYKPPAKKKRRQRIAWGLWIGGFFLVGLFAYALGMSHGLSAGPGTTPTPGFVPPQIDHGMPHPEQTQLPDWMSLLPESWRNLGGFGGGKLNWDQVQPWVNTLWTLMLGFGFLAVIYARTNRRKYIQIDQLALVVSDAREATFGKTRIIPWRCMEQIDVIYSAIPSDPAAAAATATHGNTVAVNGKSAETADNAVLHIYVDDGSLAKINWKDITSSLEPGQFINAAKTWAPDACSDTVFPDTELNPATVDSGAYTKLWFKYYSAGSERKRTTQLVAGDTLQDGRFEVAGQLGGGGQGTAYLAVDNQAPGEQKKDNIVLKEYILPVHRGQQVLEATIGKLEQEAAILRVINHKNIVKMLGSFVEDHRGYLVMEYVAGRQLKEIVAREGCQPESAVLPWAVQICDILTYLHSLTPPVVHRDLTPDNLILQDDGIVKLVDFNVAHQLESAATATVVGKHCYIPPEQFRGKPTAQSDIYALGCTLHYLLTGDEPEPLTVSKPRTKRDSVSEEMNAIVARATSLDPTKRYTCAAEMKADLLELAPELATDGMNSPFEGQLEEEAHSM